MYVLLQICLVFLFSPSICNHLCSRLASVLTGLDLWLLAACDSSDSVLAVKTCRLVVLSVLPDVSMIPTRLAGMWGSGPECSEPMGNSPIHMHFF